MRRFFVLLFSFVLLSCSSSQQSDERSSSRQDTARTQPPTPSIQPAAIKDNLTLIGAVILSLESLDEYAYKLHIHLRTAISERGQESLAEPDQKLVVVPLYRRDENDQIPMNDPRNQRLMEVRMKKEGDFLFGKISLSRDGTWYLLDTELK